MHQMGKFKFGKTFAGALNRDLNWAYHEIVTEAMFVLWIGCQLSLKFGTRFFPEWELTRIDPDKYTDLDRLLWLFLRQNITGCVWDDMVSYWKMSTPQPITNTATTSTARASAGYIGACATVVITVLLGVSVLCSLWANRHWRIPPWTQHLRNCHRITIWFGYNTTSNNRERDSGCGFVILTTILGLAVMAVFVAFWLVLSVLPVVIVAGLMVACIGRHCGEEPVFPVTVVCFSLLSVHCTGRIWGLWMKGTYFMQLHEIIRKATGVRLIVQPFAADKAPEIANKEEAPSNRPSTVERPTWLSTFGLVAFPALHFVLYHCLDVLQRLPGFVRLTNSLSSFFSSTGKQDGSTSASGSYWTYSNCIECCDNYGSGMGHSTAMVSYYVDLQYPHWKTHSPVLLALFNTVFSPVTEYFYIVWIGVIAGVFFLPFIMLALAEAACCFGCCCFCLIDLMRSSLQPNQKPKEILQREQHYRRIDLERIQEETYEPDKSTEETNKKPYCVCAHWAECERGILVVVSRLMFWIFLPYPVLGLIIPEQFQLPALLLLLSVVEAGLCYWIGKGICIGWCEVRSDSGDRIRRVQVASIDDNATLLTPC